MLSTSLVPTSLARRSICEILPLLNCETPPGLLADPFVGLVALAVSLKRHIKTKLPLAQDTREQVCRAAVGLSGMAITEAARVGLSPSELVAINQTRDAVRQAARWVPEAGTDEEFQRVVATPINDAVDAVVTLGYVVRGRRDPAIDAKSPPMLEGRLLAQRPSTDGPMVKPPGKKRGRPPLTDAQRKKMIDEYARYQASGLTWAAYLNQRGPYADQKVGQSRDQYLDACRQHWEAYQARK